MILQFCRSISHTFAQRTAPSDHLSNVTAAKQTRSERMPACAETRGKFKPRPQTLIKFGPMFLKKNIPKHSGDPCKKHMKMCIPVANDMQLPIVSSDWIILDIPQLE